MTVSATPPRNDYTGTGLLATYTYSFRIFAATDLRVTTADTDGVETELTYPADFSVTGVNVATGGTITLTAGVLAVDYALTIRFDRTPLQSTDLRNQGDFFPETHEDKFDELTRYVQALTDVVRRSLHLPETEDPANYDMTIPPEAERASKFQAYDATGNSIVSSGGLTSPPVTAFMATVLDDTTAAAARATLGVPSATNAAEGLVELATTIETLTGTDAVRAVTPDALAAIWEQGTDITAAATISVGEGGYFTVNGNTGISDIDFDTTKAGRLAWLRFTGTPTITHHATTLILLSGANIVVQAGDVMGIVSEGGDNVRCVAYFRATGLPLVRTGTLSAGTTNTKNPVVFSTQTTQAHGLSATPKFFEAYLECVTTEHGYAVGDRVPFADGDGNGTAGWNYSANATNTYISIGPGITIVPLAAGSAPQAITAVRWKAIVVPYGLN